MIDLNEYLDEFTGEKASDKIGETEFNETPLDSMLNLWSKQAHVQGLGTWKLKKLFIKLLWNLLTDKLPDNILTTLVISDKQEEYPHCQKITLRRVNTSNRKKRYVDNSIDISEPARLTDSGF